MADEVESLGVNSPSPGLSSDGAGRTIENAILRALPRKERALVLSKSEYVSLPARTILSEMSAPIATGYFLNSGVASIITIMQDGKSVEVGLTGSEGFVGLPLVVG